MRKVKISTMKTIALASKRNLRFIFYLGKSFYGLAGQQLPDDQHLHLQLLQVQLFRSERLLVLLMLRNLDKIQGVH